MTMSNPLSGRHLRVIWVNRKLKEKKSCRIVNEINHRHLINIHVAVYSLVGVAIPKDCGGHSKAALSSIFYPLVSISRDDELSSRSIVLKNFPIFKGVGVFLIFRRYEMVRVTENRLEPQGKERGLFNYLWDQV
jgi:hypothetical protein